MKLIKLVLSCLALLVLSEANAQKKKDCGHNCFSTSINSVEATEAGCYTYTLEVNNSGDCTFALSHFTVDASCGEITSLTNSENWKQEIGNTDPTTGLSGFKIDDISGFGEDNGTGSFTVTFTICPSDTECASILSCWSSVVAYKAGQCVYYDTLSYECSKLEASLISQNPTCADSNDGSVAIEITEGDGPFSYTWSNGSTDENLSGLSGGIYSVTIQDAHGDTLNLSAELVAPEPLSLNYEITNASCGGSSNGSVFVTAKGGSGEYTYQWSNGSTEASITDVAPGAYEVTVTDAIGCTYSQNFTVGAVDKLSVEAQITNAECGQANGIIDLTVSGGSGEFTFSWLDGTTTEDREQLSKGYYTVNIIDINGCTSSRTFSVKEDNPLSITGAIVPTGCPDDSTGGVNLTVSGAAGNLTYAWSNGTTEANLSRVKAGSYEVTVTNETGCSITKHFYVFGETLSLQNEINHPTCFGDENGSISIISDEEITVSWSHGATGSTIDGLAGGLYVATVSNAAGCTSTMNYFLTVPEKIEFTSSISNETCATNGYSASISVTGGVAPFTIEWKDGTQAASKNNLAQGTYQITITDANGCSTSGSVIIDETSVDCSSGEDPEDGGEDDPEGEEDNPQDGGDDNPDDGDDNGDNPDDDGGNDNPDDGDDDSDNPGNGDNDNPDEDDTDDPDNGEGSPDDGDDNGENEPGDGDGSDDGNDDPDEGDENENPGDIGENGPPTGDGECGDPYEIEISATGDGNCVAFEGKIIYSGIKSYGLSHAVISSSCGTIEGSYTENGQFEGGLDPTTNINGLKIDEINGFGEGNEGESLYFSFEICQQGCKNAENVSFIVAYKYGQCIEYDTVNVDLPQIGATATAYPNPASGRVNFQITGNDDGPILIELYNQYGIKVKDKEFQQGEPFQLDINELPNDLYTYRIISGTAVKSGKIVVTSN